VQQATKIGFLRKFNARTPGEFDQCCRMASASSIVRPNSKALRLGRYSCRDHVYHVIACTRDRLPFFEGFRSARVVIRELRHADLAGRAETLAFVVMPDHVHWLLRLRGPTSLSRTVQLMKVFSARHVNSLLRRKGSLWQRGFYDHAIRTEESLEETARYIVANPLRAGLVGRIGEFPHWDAVWL
jgi:REP element-mobilizing transposase RayT